MLLVVILLGEKITIIKARAMVLIAIGTYLMIQNKRNVILVPI
jgi:hypothetical protein